MAVQLLLPDELIVEILSILPAKSLLRCRSVCKAWLNLISSNKFKVMHLHKFNQLNPRYFVHRFNYWAIEEWFYVHLDDEAFSFDRILQLPFKISHDDIAWFRIIGCYNGVVCLFHDDDGYASTSDLLILWNPSIRRELTLPLPIYNSIDFEGSLLVLGFGYDKISDDYKVVRLAYHDYGFTGPHVEVYTVKTGIWREVMFPDNLCCIYIHYNWSRIFSNGCVHWIASDQTSTPRVSRINSIMTFDITTELFGEILLPDDDLVKQHPSTMLVSVVGESLAVTYYNRVINNLTNGAEMASSTYKIWVMKEYNNPTSWTLMFNMHYPDLDMGKPLQVRNKGDMIMESWEGNIIVYNYSGGYVCRICPEHETKKNCHTYVDKYQESLALLDVGHSVSDEETDE